VAPWVQRTSSATDLSSGLVVDAGPDHESSRCGLHLVGIGALGPGEGRSTAPSNTLLPMCRRRSPCCSCSSEPSGPRNLTRLCPSTSMMVLRHLNRLQVSCGLPFHLGDPRFEARQGPPRLATTEWKRLSISCSTAR